MLRGGFKAVRERNLRPAGRRSGIAKAGNFADRGTVELEETIPRVSASDTVVQEENKQEFVDATVGIEDQKEGPQEAEKPIGQVATPSIGKPIALTPRKEFVFKAGEKRELWRVVQSTQEVVHATVGIEDHKEDHTRLKTQLVRQQPEARGGPAHGLQKKMFVYMEGETRELWLQPKIIKPDDFEVGIK